jgi:hypothetical protein
MCMERSEDKPDISANQIFIQSFFITKAVTRDEAFSFKFEAHNRHTHIKFMSSVNALIAVGNSVSNRVLVGFANVLSCIISRNSLIMGLLETHPYQILAAALFFGCVLFRQLNKSKSGNPKGLPLPPGPKGYPLIGSLFDMPIDKPWLVYDEWRKTYGKSLKINSVLSQRFIFFYR